MKSKIRLWFLIGVLALGMSVLGTPSVSAGSGTASYAYLLGTGFLCGLAPDACPDIAMADNGDKIEISGSGTLSIHPESVTGSGPFTHKNSSGAVLATGTWTATQLLSFNNYGTSPLFPPTLHAGKALIRVHLVATGGPGAGAEADAILEVTCVLPGAKVPASSEEGIRLAVQDLLNFNKKVSGFTVFIK
jgi:hypothetical protein